MLQLLAMKTVRDASDSLNILLREGDYPHALDVINVAQEVLVTNLNGITAFRCIATAHSFTHK